jgi:hypothetical protein
MSASRHRRRPGLQLELRVQPCVRAVRASLRSCTGAGRRPRLPARHPEPQGAVRSALRRRPHCAARLFVPTPPPASWSIAGCRFARTRCSTSRHGGERNGPPGRSSSRTSSAAQRNAGMCRLYPMHRAHRIAWRGVAQAVDRILRTSSSVLMHEGFNPASPACPESSRYAIE